MKLDKKRKPLTPEQKARQRAAVDRYQAKHRERMLASRARFRKEKPERAAQSDAIYREANRQKINRQSRAWRAANPEKARQITRASYNKRKAVISLATPDEVSAIIRWEEECRAKKSVRCYWCDRKIAGTKSQIDHIFPVSKGGAHALLNLCISCGPCNRRKSAKSLDRWNATLNSPTLL